MPSRMTLLIRSIGLPLKPRLVQQLRRWSSARGWSGRVVVVRCFFHVIHGDRGFGLESSRYLDLRDGSSKSVVPYIVAATQRHVCVTARHGRA